MTNLYIDIRKPDGEKPIMTIGAEGDLCDVWTMFACAARELAEHMDMSPEKLLDGAKAVLTMMKMRSGGAE